MVQTNVLHSSYKAGVKRLLFLGSSCIYPKNAPQPLTEDYLLTGPLEPTNRPYALAKIAGIEACWSYNRQHQTQYVAAMPTNLYGPGDNYHPENSHVIPGLIRRFHQAKVEGASKVVVWGTGTPRREFMFSDDMADACVYLMNLSANQFVPLLGRDRNDGRAPLVNIGVGVDVSVRDLAEMIGQVVQFRGVLEFDASKPDGTPQKLLSVNKMKELGWSSNRPLIKGLELAYKDFLSRLSSV
jgi:GDP-L-fucose synthase